MFDLDNTIKRRLEVIESDSWLDILRSAAPETKKLLGAGYKSFGSSQLTFIKAANTLALNRVIGFGLDGMTDAKLLNSFKDEFRAVGIPRFFLQIYPDLLTPELQNDLDAAGYTFYNKWVKLYRDNSDPKEIFTDVAVMKINPDQAETWGSIVYSAFEWNDKLVHLFRDFVGKNNWHHYVGYYRGTPIAAASSYIEGEYCWMGFAATLKAYRSLGSQLAMIHKRLVDGISSGCRHFVVETAQNTAEKKSQSFLNITNMGFHPVYLRPNYIYSVQ